VSRRLLKSASGAPRGAPLTRSVGLTKSTERVKGLNAVPRRCGLLESPTLSSAVLVPARSHLVGRPVLRWPCSTPDQLRVARSGQRVHVRTDGPRLTAPCGRCGQVKRRAAEKGWLGTAHAAQLGPGVVTGCRSARWRGDGHPNYAVQRTVTAPLLPASRPVGGCAVPAADGERYVDLG
jgi:hypothetical protein